MIMAGFAGGGAISPGFVGEASNAPDIAGLRIDPRPWTEDSKEDLIGDTGFVGEVTGRGSLVGLDGVGASVSSFCTPSAVESSALPEVCPPASFCW
jgi:hypothetical protein